MGKPREVLLGRSDYDFLPAEEADVFWRQDDLVLAGGGLNENEEGLTDASGEHHVLVTRKQLHVDGEGRRFIVGVITDITDRERAEDELRRSRDELDLRVDARTRELARANERLREQDREKTEFLHALSHELRNPLAPIQNGLWLLQRGDPAAAERAAAVIARQVHHLTRIVDDLLDVARLSRGKVQLQRSPVDLATVVRHTVEDYRSLFTSRDIRLAVHADGPVALLGDDTRLGQIVANLLTNAAKFTAPGGTVDVFVERDGGHATLRVVDTGIGIPRQMLDRVFEAFVQLDPPVDRRSGGLGLGLSLVRALA
jgi:signal transduction histidine kinase